MGRQMPMDCPHGSVYDWGDFGPDPLDGSVGACPVCVPELGDSIRNEDGTLIIEIRTFDGPIILTRGDTTVIMGEDDNHTTTLRSVK